jgi:hypothetical protein
MPFQKKPAPIIIAKNRKAVLSPMITGATLIKTSVPVRLFHYLIIFECAGD